jgi:hypothetical protein
MHATCPAPLVLLDVIVRVISSEEYTLRRSSLCNYLQPPIGQLPAWSKYSHQFPVVKNAQSVIIP